MIESARDPAATTGIKSTLFTLVLPFICFSLLAILWSLASPVFSVPDENAHALKAIAQLRGQVVGYTVPDVKHIIVDLPDGYEYPPHIMCFATHPDLPASCNVELGSADGQDWFNTWVGAYNPVYYYLVGWPSLLFDGNAGIYAMRVASSLLGAALLAWAFQVAAAGARSRWMPFAIAFAAAPMSMYLIGAVNPNGAEFAAAVAVWVGVLRLLDTFRAPVQPASLSRSWLWAGVTTGSIVLVTARALGPLWLVIIVGSCFLASGWQPIRRLFTTGSSYWWLALVAAGGLFSIGWTLTGGSLSNQAEASDAPLVNGTFLQGFQYMLRTTPDFLQQAIGYFGWFDAPLPLWTYWLFIAAFAVVVVLAFIATPRRSVLTMAAVTTAAILVPALVQAFSVHQTGIIWQGRYGMFLYVGITIIAGWLLSRDAPAVGHLAPRAAWLGSSLLASFGLLAFGLVMARYVIGGQSPFSQMISDPQWQPPLGWLALVVAYAVGSLALVALIGGTSQLIARREGDDQADRDATLHPSIEASPHV